MEKAEAGNNRAQLALDIFAYRIVKYIGSYVAAMGGADAIIFTGGIGENSVAVRAKILEPLALLGAELDPVRNGSDAKEKVITKDGSRIATWVVPTNEELMIAQKTKTIVEAQVNAGSSAVLGVNLSPPRTTQKGLRPWNRKISSRPWYSSSPTPSRTP
jgi:acetate kinase